MTKKQREAIAQAVRDGNLEAVLALVGGDSKPSPPKRPRKKPGPKQSPPPPPPEPAETPLPAGNGPGGAVLLDVSVNQFRAQASNAERTQARSVPIETGIKANKFVPDTKSFLEAHKADKKVHRGKSITPRDREPVVLQKVTVRCERCGTSYEAEPYEVNRSVEGYAMENICARCMRRASGR